MVNFSFAGNKKILFGRGISSSLAGEIHKLSWNPESPLVLVSSRSITKTNAWKGICQSLKSEGLKYIHLMVSGEPGPELIDGFCKELDHEGPGLVVAIGGGSVLDTGKALSAMMVEKAPVLDYLEGQGKKTPSGRKLPFIAMPTTAGTGSECTKNAVLSRPGPEGFKKSLRHDNYIPDLAIVDSLWLEGLPEEWQISCGMDAFSQLLESYLSTRASPITDALALKGLEGFIPSFTSLLKGRASPDDFDALSLGASLSGLTLANAGLGTVHAMAGIMGGLSDIPHGTACGLLLPPVMKATFRHLQNAAAPVHPALKKLGQLGKTLGVPDESALSALMDVLDFWQDLAALPRLSTFTLEHNQLEAVAFRSGNKNNPYAFSKEQRLEVLEGLW